MVLRFLQTTPSDRPDVPFQAGQRIHVQSLTPQMRAWVDQDLVQVLPDEPERAVDEPVEMAVTQRGKRR